MSSRVYGAGSSAPRSSSSNVSLEVDAQQKRRMSRYEEFEQLLSSQETHRLSLSSSLISSSSREGNSSDMLDTLKEVETPVHSSSSSSALSTITGHSQQTPVASPYNETRGSNKRRSVFRGVGTATAPDIATLVARAKAQRSHANQSAESDEDEDEGDLTQIADTPASDSAQSSPELNQFTRESSATESFVVVGHPQDTSNAEDNTRTPTRQSHRRASSGNSSDGSDSANKNTPKNNVDKKARQPHRQATEAALLQEAIEKRYTQGIGSSNSAQTSPTSASSSTFSSTMRKTSGFFKKKFGRPSAHEAMRSSQAPSASSGSFDRNRSLPPVPALPAGYVPERTASKNASGKLAMQGSPSDNGSAPMSRKSTNASQSQAQDSPDSRRRSMSLATGTAMALARSRSSEKREVPSGSSKMEAPLEEDLAVGRDSTASSTQASATEDERLRSALNTVFPASSPAKDWDSAVEDLSQLRTPPHTADITKNDPRTVKTSDPLEYARKEGEIQNDLPVRSNSIDNSDLKPLPISPEKRLDDSAVPNGAANATASATPDVRTPSIRLVPSPRSPINPASPVDAARRMTAANRTQFSANEGPQDGLFQEPKTDGVGLGLASINPVAPSGHKSNHSIDALPSHLFTPIRKTPEPSPMLISGDLPAVVTQSPSPAHAQVAADRTRSPSKIAMRNSVVALPGSPHGFKSADDSSTTDLTAASANSAEEAEQLAEKARQAADKCWAEDESYLARHKVAEFLGSQGKLNRLALVEYIKHFDFKGLRLDNAFRKLCDKLYLKAETQQVDRILEAFASQYWTDNPDSLFGSADTVHAVTYSILLLNTDLHIADLSTRMSSKQFIRNTFFTLSSMQANNASDQDSSPIPRSTGTPNRLRSLETGAIGKETIGRARSTSIASQSSEQNSMLTDSPSRPRTTTSNSFLGKVNDPELEALLKDMYADIKLRPIYQPSAGASSLTLPDGRPSMTLSNSPYSTWNNSTVGRLGSRRSNTAPDKRGSLRGFLGPSTDSLRPSSPSPSMSTGSDAFGSTLYGSSGFTTPSSIFNPGAATFGFASNLSNTIIKEQREDDEMSDSGASATDEELALLGAPWAKEGILHRKHYWEAPNKRAKEKNWLQAFVVISKGELKMFKFGDFSRGKGGAVGGGNWLTNAQSLGDMSLTHSLCSAMPPPGYSSDRPHVFVLTLASGSSYFFQAGTQDLVQEWVSTCNYWAARLSKEPLLGGVSNIEYGWNKVMPVLDPHKTEASDDLEDLASVKSGKSGKSHHSYRSGRSGRSGKSRFSRGFAGSSNANDRVNVHDWKPPLAPLTNSTLSEEQQVDALRKHVRSLQAELEAHNELRSPMSLLFSVRSANATKASVNWEKKSQYLLSEIVKYTTYVHSLKSAMKSRQSRSAEKTMSKLLESADSSTSPPKKLATPDRSPSTAPLDDSLASASDAQNKKNGRESSIATANTDVFYDPPSG